MRLSIKTKLVTTFVLLLAVMALSTSIGLFAMSRLDQRIEELVNVSAARAALKEQFEVISVTFQDEKVHSRAAAEFGWRYTPYAYILLKPRGPQVDKLPPLRVTNDPKC